MEEEVVKKGCRKNGTFRWSKTEVSALLEAISEKVRQNVEKFEKPTSQIFYKNILHNLPELSGVTWQTAKTKMRHLKSSYVAAVSWRNQTGAGLMADGCEQSVHNYISKICPHFDVLEEIFAQRRNVQPRNIYATNEEVELSLDMSFQTEDFIDYDDSVSVTDNTLNFDEPAQGSDVCPVSTQSSPANSSAAKASPKQTTKNSNLSILLSIQEKKLNLEIEMFNWEREKEKNMLELQKAKQQQENEIAMLKIEKEKLAIEKLKREMFM